LFILTTPLNFSQLGLAQPLLKAVEELGFDMPTPVQEKVIPIFLQKEQDIVALAQTGTGKTAAFGLPIVQHTDGSRRTPQALILSPTRELCVQIANDLANYSKYTDGIKVVAVYGGAPIQGQMRDLRNGAQIVVATPGRLMDLIERQAINLSEIEFLILDEADEMLNMGFEEDVKHILSFTPETKSVGLFSATMPAEIRNIAKNYLKNPIEISLGKKNSAQQNIEHRYCLTHLDNKYEALKRLLDFYPDFFGIIFCSTKIQTQEISDALVRDGYAADCLHGDLGQAQRDKVMNHFRHHTVKILLATDVAARGIDVNDLTHVIHFQLPQDIESYTHRSGRTARAGKSGVSIAMLLPRDQPKISRIERIVQAKIEYLPIPKAAEVRDRKLTHFINTIAASPIDEKIVDSAIEDGIKQLEEFSNRELILKMLTMELHRFSTDYLKNPDLNVYQGDKPRRFRMEDDTTPNWNERTSRIKNSRFDDNNGGDIEGGSESRIFISIGSVDKIRYDEMREFLFQASGVKGKRIKDIEMKDTYSFFNTDLESAETIYNAFKNDAVNLKGRSLRVDYANTAGGGGQKREGGSNYGGGNGGGGRNYGGGGGNSYGGGKKEYGGFNNKNGSRGNSGSNGGGKFGKSNSNSTSISSKFSRKERF
jgi:ATP-dependent RNA helicase DeaD